MNEQIINQLIERIETLEKDNASIKNDAIHNNKRFKSRRQSLTVNSMTRGLCVETIDPYKMNRVRFFHPLLHEPNTKVTKLPFANPVSAFGGFDDCGVNWVPPAGSTLVLLFDNGVRHKAYYIGTTWTQTRKKGFDIPFREWEIYEGKRGGYLHGPGEDSGNNTQVFPPWNTESYNSLDNNQVKEFFTDPNEQKKTTFPNIYGFKTPEKHMLKMVDGDAKCNRRWKRFEMLSGCGNWFMMKDDHMHYGGQWAHPSCGATPGGEDVGLCSKHDAKDGLPYYTDLIGKPIEKTTCNDTGPFSTPGNPPNPPTENYNKQTGSNPAFKHKNECRPYHGPGTPQNNRCNLPQSGIQMLSLSGHTFCMDDSVEEPSGVPDWERSTQDFDFGCKDKYLGLMYMKSATGHSFTMSDIENTSKVRGDKNFMEMRSASGNFVQLNDDSVGGCPTEHAGPKRGVHIGSTSKHTIKLIDHMNVQGSPCRKEGGKPKNLATKGYIEIKSGYGLSMKFNDKSSQRETQQQSIQIKHPQCAGGTDSACNSGENDRGPHVLRFQGRPKGSPGVVLLRAGGNSIRHTYDRDIVIVGDKEKNPSDKFTYVSRRLMSVAEGVDFKYSGEKHILMAEEKIMLMAGRDCPPKEDEDGNVGKCSGPCLYPVVVGRCPRVCPITKFVHWSENSLSERVFASAKHVCQTACGNADGETTPQCDAYHSKMATAEGKGCKELDDRGDANREVNDLEDTEVTEG